MRARKGFSLIEVIVAMTLLAVIVLSLTAATARMIAAATHSARETVTLSLVQEQLGWIAADPAYGALESRYGGAETIELADAVFTRSTTITHTHQAAENGRFVDYKRITVTVGGPGAVEEVTRTIVVGAP